MIPAAKLVGFYFYFYFLPLHQIILVAVITIVIIVSYHFAFIAVCFAMPAFFSFFLLIFLLSILPRPSIHQPISFPSRFSLRFSLVLFCSLCVAVGAALVPVASVAHLVAWVSLCVRFLMVHVHGRVVNAPCTCTCC